LRWEAERVDGKSPAEAIYQACLLRFRPITLTTLAALLGGLPLALGSGPGSELRRPLGIAIVGGLIFSQMLTLYTTPVVYLYLDRLSLWLRGGERSTHWRSSAGVPQTGFQLHQGQFVPEFESGPASSSWWERRRSQLRTRTRSIAGFVHVQDLQRHQRGCSTVLARSRVCPARYRSARAVPGCSSRLDAGARVGSVEHIHAMLRRSP